MNTNMLKSPHRTITAISVALWSLLAVFALADGIPAHLEDYAIDSRQPSPHASESPDGQLAYLVTVPDAPWLRVKIAEYSLSPQSYLLFTSIKDGSAQRTLAVYYDRLSEDDGVWRFQWHHFSLYYLGPPDLSASYLDAMEYGPPPGFPADDDPTPVPVR